MTHFLVWAGAMVLAAVQAATAADGIEFWPQWRGPLATGAAPKADPPVTWSQTNNVKWKVSVPGFGTSTPIVWGDQLFIQTAIPTGKTPPVDTNAPGAKATEIQRFELLCYQRSDGKLLWQKPLREEAPHESHHKDHGFASASPVTDGLVVLAYFGSRGLHCLDMNGNLKWSKDLGRMKTRNAFGEGASPALNGNIVVVNWDDETENDFIVAFDKRTGKELWRTPRKEDTGWATPLIVEFQGKRQVIVNATGKVRGYDLETGKDLWQCGGQTANAIPSPVASSDTVYVTSGFRGSAVFAIALGKTGDLAGTDAIRWSRTKNTPYVPSPLFVENLLYLVTGNNGVLTCLDAKTGEPRFEGQELENIPGIYASPVASKGRIYVLGRNGLCLVLKQGPSLQILARNDIGEKTDASLALAGNDLFIRTHQSLFCIAER
jgi:outer membrane protein assembly factor BamB